MSSNDSRCRWIGLSDALATFVRNEHGHQGQAHIRPLHWYTACRLVIEGGLDPDDVTPRPPFVVTRDRHGRRLSHEPESGRSGERTVLGGLKTKDVDVVVAKDGIGPCLAVSIKGSLGAFRNLTNRLEEAVGDCTNLHMTYPALVYGFLAAIRANRRDPAVLAGEAVAAGAELERVILSNDLAVSDDGQPVQMILKFHQALAELSGRRGIRNDVSRYEAVALILADATETSVGQVVPGFPAAGSPLTFDGFFASLYRRYDERFVYGAPDLGAVTARHMWSESSPAFAAEDGAAMVKMGYEPRLAG